MTVPTPAQILRVAQAFGLGGDIIDNPNMRDSFEKLVVLREDSMAFLTLVEHVFHKPRNCLFTIGKSEFALHNATQKPSLVVEWEKRIQLISKKHDGMILHPKKWIRDVEYCQHYDLHDATFAATEINGVPERIFLFVSNPYFNLERVVELLRTYRILERLPEINELYNWYGVF